MTTRGERLARLREEQFDVLVVGGGITGAGIARDAAMRGLKTALVERDDFASGTSSRSSRLVHGGVRYLEHGHLHLVFESSRERRTLLRIAPHLVRPLRFTWPVYRDARVPLWKLGAGLFIYDALAVFRNVKGHRLLTAKETWGEEPALSRLNLVGGASYYDASTDDARLTLANVIAAEELGCAAVNHAAVVRLIRERERIVGAIVRDDGDEAEVSVRARVVVNATGPWTDTLRAMIPGPAPVMIAKPASARSRATSVAFWYCGSSGPVRAEPKTVTPFWTDARVSKPSMNSLVMRSTRHGSVRVKSSKRPACCRSFSSSVTTA